MTDTSSLFIDHIIEDKRMRYEDDFDSDYDDLSTMLILDEIDDEDEMDDEDDYISGSSGCLSIILMILMLPVIVLSMIFLWWR